MKNIRNKRKKFFSKKWNINKIIKSVLKKFSFQLNLKYISFFFQCE
jgi:hypothetical protein